MDQAKTNDKAAASKYLELGMHCGPLPVPFPRYYSPNISPSTIVYAWNVGAHGTDPTPHTNIVKLNKNRYNKQLIPPGPGLTIEAVRNPIPWKS